MGTHYPCNNPRRAQAIRDFNRTTPAPARPVQGIDSLEVLDDGTGPWSEHRQRLLLVYGFTSFVRDGSSLVEPADVTLGGGVRVRNIAVVWTKPASLLSASAPAGSAEAAAKAYVDTLGLAPAEQETLLVVHTGVNGDFSDYTLTLQAGAVDEPTQTLDPILASVTFSFKVACPSDFDCVSRVAARPPSPSEPRIDYLARDYNALRRLMLDRLATVLPGWTERSPADVGIAVVEGLAYVADHLSYYQDAVATEAYLGTARKRVSVRRHARLLDYFLHDGCNARTWVALEVSGPSVEGYPLIKGPTDTAPGTQLLTWTSGLETVVAEGDVAAALGAGGEVFEALQSATLYPGNNELPFYTWGETDCCLPEGATSATVSLVDVPPESPTHLQAGDLLLLEEVRGADSGLEADADPTRRHVVRLTRVTTTSDPLDPATTDKLLELTWDAEDALPFTLCLHTVADPVQPDQTVPVSVARGNLVLADHGRSVSTEPLPGVPDGRYRPQLQEGPLTQQGYGLDAMGNPLLFDPAAPAARAMRWEMRHVRPSISLTAEGSAERWTALRDLLSSDGFTTAFVVESEDDETACLRFGDDIYGRAPAPGTQLYARYRVGNGTRGNLGADALAHLLTPQDPTADYGPITRLRNPLPARGGVEPESIDEAKLRAPQAFRTQRRAVTEADYATIAGQFPGVQRAVATSRWTGAWSTIYVAVDRTGGLAVDSAFKQQLTAWLERHRMARHDIRVEGPRYVALDIAFTVYLQEGRIRSDVYQALLEALSNKDLGDGRRGFFHPDHFSFGQPVYLSRLVQTIMARDGVAWVDTTARDDREHRFQRYGQAAQGELAEGSIPIGRIEIARLDNDPSQPEYGRLQIYLEGGL